MGDNRVSKTVSGFATETVEIDDSRYVVESEGVEFDKTLAKVDDREFEFLYAKSASERYQGLSDRESLDADGMLFEYPREEKHRLVFRNMNFPLDVLFLDEDGNIVDNGSLDEENQATESVCLYALEVEKGWIEENNISLTDSFDFQFNKLTKQVPDKYVDGTGLSEDDFVPNADVNDVVEDVLEFIDEHGLPNPDAQREGASRANQIHDHFVDDEPLGYEYWEEIYNFHQRHRAQGNHECDESSIAESDKEEINQNEHDVCFFDNGYFSDHTWGSDAGYDQAERIVTAIEDAGVEKQWSPYEGPQGGFGWTDGEDVVYQEEPPGDVDLSNLTDEQVEQLEDELGEDLMDDRSEEDYYSPPVFDDVEVGDTIYYSRYAEPKEHTVVDINESEIVGNKIIVEDKFGEKTSIGAEKWQDDVLPQTDMPSDGNVSEWTTEGSVLDITREDAEGNEKSYKAPVRNVSGNIVELGGNEPYVPNTLMITDEGALAPFDTASEQTNYFSPEHGDLSYTGESDGYREYIFEDSEGNEVVVNPDEENLFEKPVEDIGMSKTPEYELLDESLGQERADVVRDTVESILENNDTTVKTVRAEDNLSIGGNDTVAAYTPSTGDISLSVDSMNDEELQKYAFKMEEEGWLAGGEIEHIAAHETMHSLHNHKVDNIKRGWDSQEDKKVAGNISEYAEYKPSEFVAEFGALLLRGQSLEDVLDDPSQADAIEELFEEYAGMSVDEVNSI